MASEGGESHGTVSERWVWLLRCIASGAAIPVCGSFMVALAIELNVRLSLVPWFLIPAIAAIGFGIWTARRLDPSTGTQRHLALRAAWMSVAFGLALGLIAAGLTGIENIRSGSALLPGDRFHAPLEFQVSATLAILMTAASFEEIGMRGVIQYRLARHWHPHYCEIVAGLAFVTMHFLRYQSMGQLLFVCLLALICGRAAAISRTIVWPICIHLVANITVTGLVLLGRM